MRTVLSYENNFFALPIRDTLISSEAFMESVLLMT